MSAIIVSIVSLSISLPSRKKSLYPTFWPAENGLHRMKIRLLGQEWHFLCSIFITVQYGTTVVSTPCIIFKSTVLDPMMNFRSKEACICRLEYISGTRGFTGPSNRKERGGVYTVEAPRKKFIDLVWMYENWTLILDMGS